MIIDIDASIMHICGPFIWMEIFVDHRVARRRYYLRPTFYNELCSTTRWCPIISTQPLFDRLALA